MDDLQKLIKKAAEVGFSHAGELDASTLSFIPEVREMCAAGRCNRYGKSWSCPPACGTLEEMSKRASGYSRGFIVQTVGELEDDFDFETMEETQKLHNASFQALTPVVLESFPNAFPMGAGSCTICRECTYPDAPCRFPDKVWPSMEACGLMVSDVCKKNGLPYNYGKCTICYTSCYLTD